MAGLCEGGNEHPGSLKAICKWKMIRMNGEAVQMLHTTKPRILKKEIISASGISQQHANSDPDVVEIRNRLHTTQQGIIYQQMERGRLEDESKNGNTPKLWKEQAVGLQSEDEEEEEEEISNTMLLASMK
ncbi:hypothetical protein ANN_05163 [Periplaneta americana]|uniref:Uncharacterized protein n=1 Tax=Periplaneta americana TaxID=6978 RepID=A0ABQ8TC11_PERAM|nr:hypothetical protein ANN_05163 [Periplaneta americana]